MKIRKSAVVSLLVALGFKTAGNWSESKILGKVKTFSEDSDEYEDIGEKVGDLKSKQQKTFNKLQEALAEDEPIKLVSGKSKKSDKKGSKKGTSSKKSKKSGKKKKTTSKKASKKKGGKKKAPVKRGPTDKSRIYKLWQKSKDKSPAKAESLIKKAKASVKINTVKSWISGWKNGRGLPASTE